ncbi:type II toxin-antitoxin system HicB family antitoxin [bacterium]|nr:type II toxin-antitoxin system HicB family antitoxin [bacterium]
MKKKDLTYYLNLPWQFEFTKHPDGKFSARVEGLSCYSGGDTLEEASREIQEALKFYIESCLEDNLLIPEPDLMAAASGKISVRTSKATHLKLIKLAERENVSVSHLVNDAIIKQYG